MKVNLLLFVFLLFGWGISAQVDSNSRHAFSLHFQYGKHFFTDLTSLAIDPDLRYDLRYSYRVKNRMFLSTGIGINRYASRTNPFVRSYTVYNYGNPNGIVYTDDYERETRNTYLDLHIPLRIEYFPLGKLKPYYSVGVGLDVNLIHKQMDVLAGTNRLAQIDYFHLSHAPSGIGQYMLGPELSGGIKFQKGRTEFLIGVLGEIKTEISSEERSTKYYIGAEFALRRSIKSEKFPHQEGIITDTMRGKKKNYAYVEFLGSAPLASLNYERAVYTNERHKVSARIGVGVWWNEVPVPIGISWSYGYVHQIETGFNVTPLISKSTSYYYAPYLGYRMERPSSFLFRFTFTPWWLIKTDQFMAGFGASVGKRF